MPSVGYFFCSAKEDKSGRGEFLFQMKSTHLLGMIALFAAGVGLMLRSYRDDGPSKDKSEEKEDPPEKN